MAAKLRSVLSARVLDRVEARAAGREVGQARSRGLDHLAHERTLVAGQVVHDHDIAGPEVRDEDLGHAGLEGAPVDRPVEDEGCHDPVLSQAGHRQTA